MAVKAGGAEQVEITVRKSDVTYNENNAVYLTLYAESAGGDYKEDNNTAYIILYKEQSGGKAPEDGSQGTTPGKEVPPARGAVLRDKTGNQYIVTIPGAKGKTGAVTYKAPASKKVKKVPKKKLKAYKKLLRAKGVGRKAKIKK